MPNLILIHREMKECTLDFTIKLVTALLPRPNNNSHAFAVDTLTLLNLQTHHGSVVLITSAGIEPGAGNHITHENIPLNHDQDQALPSQHPHVSRLFHLKYNRGNSVPYPIRKRIGCFSMLYISDLSVFQNLIFSTFEVRSV